MKSERKTKIVWAMVVSGIAFLCSISGASAETKFLERTLEINGKSVSYHLYLSINAHHEREVIIEHEEVRPYAPTMPVTALIGRDLDGDGRFDAWFYMGNDGVMESLEMPSKRVDGWDAAQVILRQHTQLENRWLASVMLHSLANYILTTGKPGKPAEVLQLMAVQEVELLDLGVRADRLAKVDPKSKQLGPIYQTLSDGWEQISEEATAELKDIIYGSILYVGLYVAGDLTIKALSKLGPVLTKVVEGSETLSAAAEMSNRFLNGVKAQAKLAFEKIGFLKVVGETVTERVVVPYQFLKLSVNNRITVLIESLAERGRIGKLAAQMVIAGKGYGGSALKNIPYMIWTQSLQLASEIYDKRQVLFSKNPIIMKNRVLSDKDLIQDMSYMTMETAVTATIIHRNGNGLSGYAKAGLFSMVDSNVMNYWVKGETDLKRDALDTGWEVGVGNLQTVCDMRTLSYFEKMSEESGNSNLKIVGYLVTGIDQFVGYVAYGKVTEWYEKNNKKEKVPVLTITPILAPTH